MERVAAHPKLSAKLRRSVKTASSSVKIRKRTFSHSLATSDRNKGPLLCLLDLNGDPKQIPGAQPAQLGDGRLLPLGLLRELLPLCGQQTLRLFGAFSELGAGEGGRGGGKGGEGGRGGGGGEERGPWEASLKLVFSFLRGLWGPWEVSLKMGDQEENRKSLWEWGRGGKGGKGGVKKTPPNKWTPFLLARRNKQEVDCFRGLL